LKIGEFERADAVTKRYIRKNAKTFLLYEPLNFELRVAVLNYLRIFILNRS